MSRLIDRLRLRLASLLSGDRVEESLKNEIELHLQEQVDENVAAGMSPADARAAAVRAFGPVGVIEEQCRDTRRVAFIEHVVQDLRYTLRSLLRQPTLMAAAVRDMPAQKPNFTPTIICRTLSGNPKIGNTASNRKNQPPSTPSTHWRAS